MIEDGTASDDDVGPRFDDLASGAWLDATVDLEIDVEASIVNHVADLGELGSGRGNEALPTEPRIDAHDEHQIDVGQNILQAIGWCVGVERNSGTLSQGADLLERPVKMGARLRVHGDHVRPGLRKRLNIFLRFDNHEMGVDGLRRRGTDRLHDQRTNRDVGHETAIHDIDVDPIGARLIDRLDFSLKTAKISGKD